MSTDIKWEHPKDPSDKAWYGMPFPYDLDNVTGVTIMDVGPLDFATVGHWHTPGDYIPNARDVSAQSVQVGTDGRTVMMWLIDGKPAREYAIQAHVKDMAGNELNRTAILKVHGQ